jgi:hypothetical protein
MSALEKLTEGIVARDLQKEGAALLNKWEGTGLLEGLNSDVTKNNMARLLENQAKELLREASTMAAGDVEGFSAVAFPIVRRVFGELIANELVSVQPMSLPSGLIFFLDFTSSTEKLGYDQNASLFGGGAVAAQITGGIDLGSTFPGLNAEKGPYALNNGYASPTGTVSVTISAVASGTYGAGVTESTMGDGDTVTSDTFDKLLRYDPDIASGTNCAIASVPVATLSAAGVNMDNLITLSSGGLSNEVLLRRLTRIDPDDNTRVLLVAIPAASETGRTPAQLTTALTAITVIDAAITDNFAASNAVGSVRGQSEWALENTPNIPEIDIKVDSVAITANTKKLKAKWSPELGQDLNAYHNLDAEVELTSILSEQIALEIDQEILNDLIQGAAKGAGVRYWSRAAGKFVNRVTGVEVGASTAAPDFTGTVSEWYETLLETINDVSAEIHRRTVRGGANFVVCSPEVANILEFTAGFRANVTVDANGTAGAVNVGSISKKLDVYVDPYFPRNVVLVGRRGNSFLESGYVYAPYVPLQVTPTIFGTEDFVPRKGVMTRYGKKMVRPDMYGLVICQDLV